MGGIFLIHRDKVSLFRETFIEMNGMCVGFFPAANNCLQDINKHREWNTIKERERVGRLPQKSVCFVM